MNRREEIDLVDEMEEDGNEIEKISLDEAKLEESTSPMDRTFTHSILDYLDWFYDGQCSEFDRE